MNKLLHFIAVTALSGLTATSIKAEEFNLTQFIWAHWNPESQLNLLPYPEATPDKVIAAVHEEGGSVTEVRKPRVRVVTLTRAEMSTASAIQLRAGILTPIRGENLPFVCDGRFTGKSYDPTAYTVMVRGAPCGTRLALTNLQTGASLEVQVADNDSPVDLAVSQAAARVLDLPENGKRHPLVVRLLDDAETVADLPDLVPALLRELAPVKQPAREDLLAMAANLVGECTPLSRSCPHRFGRINVVSSVMWRVRIRHKGVTSIKQAVYDDLQYSWANEQETKDRIIAKVGTTPEGRVALQEARDIITGELSGGDLTMRCLTRYVENYHTEAVSPKWSHSDKLIALFKTNALREIAEHVSYIPRDITAKLTKLAQLEH